MVCCWFRKQVSTENEIRNALARALLYLLMLPSLTNEDLFLLQGHLRKLRLFPYANMSEIYTTTSRMYKIDNHWMSMHLAIRKKGFGTKTGIIRIKYFVCLQISIGFDTIMHANFAEKAVWCIFCLKASFDRFAIWRFIYIRHALYFM